MSVEKVVQNMVNLARHSGFIPEGKEELFKIFIKIVYQTAKFDAIIEKTRILHLIKKGEDKEPEPKKCNCVPGLGPSSTCPIHRSNLPGWSNDTY
jgi:hypothetical protein